MDTNTERFSIVLFSGTVDKLLAAVTLVSGAAAMGKEVTLFLTYWGVEAFRKDAWKKNTRITAEFEDYKGPMLEAMQAKNVPSWMSTLETALELGSVSVKACAATMEMFDIKLEDLEPVVSEVTGVASFISDSEGGPVLFI